MNGDLPVAFLRTFTMVAENCENLVIGSGVGGRHLAVTLARRGQKTVVVERSMIGGSCVNVACLPSKNVIYSAKPYRSSIPRRVWALRRAGRRGYGWRRSSKTADGEGSHRHAPRQFQSQRD